MRRLIFTFVVRIRLKQVFSLRGSFRSWIRQQVFWFFFKQSLCIQTRWYWLAENYLFTTHISCFITAEGSVARPEASAWHADGRGFDPWVRQHSFVKIGQKMISTVILSLPLIQVGQLSVTGERMCTVLINRLGSLLRNYVVRLIDRLDMTIVVDWDVKPQIKRNKTTAKFYVAFLPYIALWLAQEDHQTLHWGSRLPEIRNRMMLLIARERRPWNHWGTMGLYASRLGWDLQITCR